MQNEQRLKKVNEFISLHLKKGVIVKETKDEIYVADVGEKSSEIIKRLINNNVIDGMFGGKVVIKYNNIRIIIEGDT
jgi:hypothetical protein